VDGDGIPQRWNLIQRWQAGLIELPPLSSGNGSGDCVATYLNRQPGWRSAHRHGLPTDEREWNLAGRRKREGVSIPIKDCPLCFCSCPSAAQQCPDCGHLFLSEERDEQRRGLQQLEGELVEIVAGAHRPKPRQQQRPRRRSPSAGCRPFEQLQQREQERGYKPGWAKHVWAARQRGLQL
jgi:hypothetical protein